MNRLLTPPLSRRLAALIAACILGLATGCAYLGVVEALTTYDLTTDPDGDGSLATARPVAWLGDAAYVTGGISIDEARLALAAAYLGGEIVGNFAPPPTEVDIFDLGDLNQGDIIRAQIDSLTRTLVNLTPFAQAEIVRNAADQVAILVDSQSRIIGYPVAAPIWISEPGRYYIVMQSFVPADYSLWILRAHDQPEPTPAPGVLLLQFGGRSDLNATFLEEDGTLIRINELPAFDLEQSRPDLPGLTDRFRETIRQFVEYTYADYNIRVTLDLAEAEAAGHYDLLVFTTPSADDLGFNDPTGSTLGLEPTIDVEDRNGQAGIVFIQAFEKARYFDFNTFSALWASVAAHEFGHALGLWHVQQATGSLMSPALSSAADGRALKQLLSGVKREEDSAPAIELIQDPDLYLSRVVGRRPADEAEAIRQRTYEIVPEWAP